MIMSLVVIVLVALIAYLWSAKGFYSSLIHMTIVLASGAIAFGVWEPLAYWMLTAVGDEWLMDLTWGAALLGPFVISAIILTVLTNTLLRANVAVSGVVNYIGGGLCGLIAAVVSVGVGVIAVSGVKAAGSSLGYEPMQYESSGSITRKNNLIAPVDTLTASLYSMMSEASLASGTPMAKWRPNAASDGFLLSLMPRDVLLRYAAKEGDIKVQSRYTVGAADGNIATDNLTGDNKGVMSLDGQTVSRGYIEGYMISMGAGTREKNGQVSIGAGQFQLVVRSADDTESMSIVPIAVVSQAKGDKPIFGRWRFDGKEVFLGSAGAGAEPTIAVEFLIPTDDRQWKPLALYAKGVRIKTLQDDSTEPPTETLKPANEFEDLGALRAFVASGALVSSGAALTGDATIINTRQPVNYVRPGKAVPFNIRLNKGALRGLEANDKNEIIGGDSKFAPSDLLGRGSERSLEVSAFYRGADTSIMTIDVSRDSALSILTGASADADGAPTLVDTSGQRYECIGFVYKDKGIIHVRFTPGKPIQGKSDLASTSKSRDDQQLALIFRVSAGVQISEYVIGSSRIVQFEPPLNAETR